MIAELAEAASTDSERSAIGIALIEDLVYEHGDRVVAPLLDRARRTSALADAIGWVSLAPGSVSDRSSAALAKHKRAR